MKWLFKLIARQKIYVGRAGAYIGILNTLLLLMTFKQIYHIDIPAIYILIVGAIGILILGKLDYHLIMKHEVRHNNLQNDLKSDLKEIKELLNK